jgi:hypothetical protein
VQSLSHQRNKNNVLFELICIGGSPSTEIKVPNNQDDLGIAIWMCVQWKCLGWVTLTECESDYGEKLKLTLSTVGNV